MSVCQLEGCIHAEIIFCVLKIKKNENSVTAAQDWLWEGDSTCGFWVENSQEQTEQNEG